MKVQNLRGQRTEECRRLRHLYGDYGSVRLKYQFKDYVPVDDGLMSCIPTIPSRENLLFIEYDI